MTAHILQLVATLFLGAYGGAMIFDGFSPSIYRMPGAAFVSYQNAMTHDMARGGPILLGGSILFVAAALTTTVIASAQHEPATEASLVRIVVDAGVLLLLIAALLITLIGLGPLNRATLELDPQQLSDDWERLRDQWLHLHTIRRVVSAGAFVLVLVPLAYRLPN